MALDILDATTLANVRACTDQEAQLAALVAPFVTAGAVTAWVYVGATHASTNTHGAWTINTAVTPRTMTLGARSAHAPITTGAPTSVVFRAGSTDIFSLSAGVGSGDVSFAANIGAAGSIERLAVTVTATSSLPVNALPAWVPAANTVAQLTVGDGLANTYNSQCASYFDTYYFNTTNSTYGGAFKNPYWGQYGCTLFGSGGHGNHNDNSLVVAEYGATQITFKRVMDPTPYFGTATDATTKGYNSAAGFTDVYNSTTVMEGVDLIVPWNQGDAERSPWDYNYGVSTLGGKMRVGASHTYGGRVFIGPADGGAPQGTLLSLWQPALNRFSQNGVVSAMAVDFTSTSTASSATEWYKHSTERYAESVYNGQSPIITAHVPAQDRVYIQTRGGDYGVRWYDLAGATYVTGTGVGFDFWLGDNLADNEHGALMFIPSRSLLLCAYRYSGVCKIQWMDVSVAQPTMASGGGGTANLGASFPVSELWGAITWCPDNNRLIAFGTGLRDDLTKRQSIFEIEIPSTLSDPWTVTEVTALGDAMPDLVSHPKAAPGPWQFHYGKRTEYDPGVKSIVYYENRNNNADVVYVYRPRNT